VGGCVGLAFLIWVSIESFLGFRFYLAIEQEVEEVEEVNLLLAAQEMVENYGHLPYLFGGNHPDQGGFDCSGSIEYLLSSLGYDVPRTSEQQYLWLKQEGCLHMVDQNARSLQDDSFGSLQKGDLIFWSGTYQPTDNRSIGVTHVALYMGRQKDGRPLIACSSSGRSYRGQKREGFGLYDFVLPRQGSSSRVIAYGPLPKGGG